MLLDVLPQLAYRHLICHLYVLQRLAIDKLADECCVILPHLGCHDVA